MAAARPLPVATSGGDVHKTVSAAFSGQGPPLPYPKESRSLIQRHLAALAASFPSLRPSSGLFTYNDGSSVNLLCANGAITISFPSATGRPWYLPVTIWLLEFYPELPPSVIVSFPPGTAAKRGHALVDPSGAVCIPYLRSWSTPHHNLVDLVRSISRLFSQDPPFLVPSRDIKAELVEMIAAKVERDLDTSRRRHDAEMEEQVALQSELERRRRAVDGGLRRLEEELEGLEQQLQMVKMNSDVLQMWVEQSRWKSSASARVVDVDEAVDAVDEQSRQLAECTAADMAVEDAIYALDAAAMERCIPIDVYLRSVRALAREQFFHRAAAKKIRAAQVGAQTRPPAGRWPENA